MSIDIAIQLIDGLALFNSNHIPDGTWGFFGSLLKR